MLESHVHVSIYTHTYMQNILTYNHVLYKSLSLHLIRVFKMLDHWSAPEERKEKFQVRKFVVAFSIPTPQASNEMKPMETLLNPFSLKTPTSMVAPETMKKYFSPAQVTEIFFQVIEIFSDTMHKYRRNLGRKSSKWAAQIWFLKYHS